jgi:hypothetical protein
MFRESWIALYGEDGVLGKLPLIDLNRERALGNWWSVLQFILAAALLAINGVAEPNRRWKPHWFVLAAIFVFLSLDEATQVHESLVGWLAPYHYSDFLLFSWIIPYSVACLAIGLLYLPFVLALPRPIRGRVILAGGLFIVAAMGMEAVGGHCATIHSTSCWQLEVIAEEGGETIALTLFMLALLSLLGSRCRTFTFALQNRP